MPLLELRFFFSCKMLFFPGGSEVETLPANAGDNGDSGVLSSIPGLGRSPGEGNGNPLQYSCLENPMDRGAWRATVHGIAKSQTTERLSMHTLTVVLNFCTPRSGMETTCHSVQAPCFKDGKLKLTKRSSWKTEVPGLWGCFPRSFRSLLAK